MSWATRHIQQLQQGQTVKFRPRGNSMSGIIESGQLCTIEPIDPSTLKVGDVVLCKVHKNQYLHLISAIRGNQFKISNNRGFDNGWTSGDKIFGRCVKIEA